MAPVPRWQSVVFLSAAAVACLAALFGVRLAVQSELLVAAGLIGLAGLPHGAIDPLLAARVYRFSRPSEWAVFVACYAGLALSVVLLWTLAPALFLAGFLLISLLHFSEDLVSGAHWLSRLAYGAAVVVLPMVRYGPETARLLGLVVGAEAAMPVTMLLSQAAWPLLAVALLSGLIEGWRRPMTGAEIAGVAMLSVCAPPLVSFTVFFCLMHSLRHLLRAALDEGTLSVRALVRAAAWPMVGTGAAALVAWRLLGTQSLDAAVMQLIFVGLAALTVPHMVLVEVAARAGWPGGVPAPSLRPMQANG
jgi:Brp/Blh family beta-carotene 15,15'-monooxygenase